MAVIAVSSSSESARYVDIEKWFRFVLAHKVHERGRGMRRQEGQTILGSRGDRHLKGPNQERAR